MQKKDILISMFTACLLFSGCDLSQNEPANTDQETSSVQSRLIDIEPEDEAVLISQKSLAKRGLSTPPEYWNILCEYLARAHAVSMADQEYSAALKSEIKKKFSGDHEALWKKAKSLPSKNGNVRDFISSKFTRKALTSGIMEMFDDFVLLNIAMPENFDKWQPGDPILVAFIDYTVNDIDAKTITAYDQNLKKHKLSALEAPDQPVLVIGLNERCDPETGELNYQPIENVIQPETTPPFEDKDGAGEKVSDWDASRSLPSLGKASATHVTGLAGYNQVPNTKVYLSYLYISNDLEPWYQGNAEVFIKLLTDLNKNSSFQKSDVVDDQNYNLEQFVFHNVQDLNKFIAIEGWEQDVSGWNVDATLGLKVPADSGGPYMDLSVSYKVGGADDYFGQNGLVYLRGGPLRGTDTYPAGYMYVRFDWDGTAEYELTGLYNIGVFWLDMNTTIGKSDDWNITGSDNQEVAYKVTFATSGLLDVNTCHAYTNYDTKIEIFDANGYSTGIYNDDTNLHPSCAGNKSAIWNAWVNAGTYYIVVDGYGQQAGNYLLQMWKH